VGPVSDPIPISLGTGSNRARFGLAGAERHINCYVEQLGDEAADPSVIVAHDGLSDFATMASAGVRGMIEVGAYLYVVSGRQVYRVDAGGGVTTIGGIPTDGPVYMARNRRAVPQIGILSSGLFYVIDTGANTLQLVTGATSTSATLTDPTLTDPTLTDPSLGSSSSAWTLPPGSSLTVLDGYGIIPVSNGRWFTTGIDDFTTIDELDFGTADSNPDEIVRAETREGEVVLFGTRSTEWWKDTGDVDFPFKDGRVAIAELGCLAAGSVAKIDRTLAWIAHDGTVRLMSGYDGQRISTHAVERDIASAVPEQITSTSWAARGHSFYQISSPDWTWCWNRTTNTWSERQSYGNTRWRCSTVSKFGTKWIAGDATLGKLYTMSPDVAVEGNAPLVMTVRTPPVHSFPNRLDASALYVRPVMGVGTNTGVTQDDNPELMMRLSFDGGEVWNGEDRASLGRQGERIERVKFTRLGHIPAQGCTFEFSISAAVIKGLIGPAYLDAKKLAP
jgi:hypothetical protein